jgi:2-polyprenyl-3-methyl-5-hydroxy-6-metoxy-1,4-benzoquinol methylase
MESVNGEMRMSEPQIEDFETITEYLLQLKLKNIFDAGFGNAKWLEWAIKHGIDFRGIEIDPRLVQQSREKYPDYSKKLHRGDMTSGALAKFEDNSADVVLLIEVIEHIRSAEDVVALIRECTRIARRKVIMTTPNCGDEKILREHGLTYLHFTHIATDGMKFTIDRAHRHWLRFTKGNLTELLSGNFTHFKVTEKKPIQVLKVLCYDKLWVEINAEEEKKHG